MQDRPAWNRASSPERIRRLFFKIALPVLCGLAALPALLVSQVRGAQSAPIRSAQPQAPQPPRITPPMPVLPPAPQRYVVVLDAAHGGDDAGAHLNTQAEKAFTLALSVRLRSLLGARGIQTVTTRESDVSVTPNRRIEIANHASAQACISLHASESGSGVHIFISSLAPSQSSRYTAWKTAQAPFVNKSLALAGVLESALQHSSINVMPVRTVLPVIDSMSCPAVDIEIAPDRASSHPDQAKLASSTYQIHIAEALAAALLEWRSSSLRTSEGPKE